MQNFKFFSLAITLMALLQVTLIKSNASAQELIIRYAAHDYKGSPQFKIFAFDEGRRSAAWSSKVITAEGGIDTERYGGEGTLQWREASVKVPSELKISYFQIRFLNDYCCGDEKGGGSVFGDRNLFVQSIVFDGDRYLAAKGRQNTCPTGGNNPGEMYCDGTLDIQIAKKIEQIEQEEPKVASGVKSVCGYVFENNKSKNDLMQLQGALAKLNLYAGAIDGIFGPASCAALKLWAACGNIKSQSMGTKELTKLIEADVSDLDPSCDDIKGDPLLSAPTLPKADVTVADAADAAPVAPTADVIVADAADAAPVAPTVEVTVADAADAAPVAPKADVTVADAADAAPVAPKADVTVADAADAAPVAPKDGILVAETTNTASLPPKAETGGESGPNDKYQAGVLTEVPLTQSQAVSAADQVAGGSAANERSATSLVCRQAQSNQLALLNSELDMKKKNYLEIEGQIDQLLDMRSSFRTEDCSVFASQSTESSENLERIRESVKVEEALIAAAVNDLSKAEGLMALLDELETPKELCLPINEPLRSAVSEYIKGIDPMYLGVDCSALTNEYENPVQIVVDEINQEILGLFQLHISESEISQLKAARDVKKQELGSLSARLADMEVAKISPEEIESQQEKNGALKQTVEEIDALRSSLESEVIALDIIITNNSEIIKSIDSLNQRLVTLSTEKTSLENTLAQAKSSKLSAEAKISQLELESSKLEAKVSELSAQMEAAFNTAEILEGDVMALSQNETETLNRIKLLEGQVLEAQRLIANANSEIASGSQELSKLEAQLSEALTEANKFSTSLTMLAPQADAAEITVSDLRSSLETEFVPVTDFQEKASILSKLTEVVTERTKLIRELQSDLVSIEQEEQVLVEMCLADAKCSDAMSDRLGVEQ